MSEQLVEKNEIFEGLTTIAVLVHAVRHHFCNGIADHFEGLVALYLPESPDAVAVDAAIERAEHETVIDFNLPNLCLF